MNTLAVVPIFITAGSAVLPTVLAAVAGAAAVLLRPRDLVAAVRRRPVPVVATAFVAACGVAVLWARPTPARVRLVAPASKIDWSAVARQIIDHDALAAAGPTTSPSPASPTAPPVAPPARVALVEGRTFARTNSDDRPGPRNLKPLWSYTPDDTMFLATPAVAGGRVFVAGCVAGLGDYTGLVACLDTATGKAVWEVGEAGGEPLKACFSSPAVSADGKSVIVGQGFHQDRNCALLCFDADTGRLRWAVKSTEHIESSPAVLGDVAVVGVGAIEDHAGRPTGDPGYVMAVRVSDGRPLWKQPVVDAESTPAIDTDGTVYEGSGLNGNAIVALPALASDSAGVPAPLWRTEVGLAVTGTITLAGDLVVAGAGNGDFAHSNASPEGAVIALDKTTGRERWRARLADTVLGPVAYRDGRLYAPVRNSEVVALDAGDGRVLWKSDVSGAYAVLAGCAVTADAVYAYAADGTLAVLDRDSGKVLERVATNDPAKPGSGLASSAPQVVDGRVYVGSETGGVRCYVAGKATP